MAEKEPVTAKHSQTANSVPRMGGRILFWIALALAVVITDQSTKLMVTDSLTLYQRVQVLPFFDVVRLHNTGAAFSILAGAAGWQRWLFSGVAAVVSLGILWWLSTLPRSGRNILALGLALVLAGAIGNVIDRIAFGYVVDFLLFYWRSWSYPAFNVADASITCGVGLILLDGLVLERRRTAARRS